MCHHRLLDKPVSKWVQSCSERIKMCPSAKTRNQNVIQPQNFFYWDHFIYFDVFTLFDVRNKAVISCHFSIDVFFPLLNRLVPGALCVGTKASACNSRLDSHTKLFFSFLSLIGRRWPTNPFSLFDREVSKNWLRSVDFHEWTACSKNAVMEYGVF